MELRGEYRILSKSEEKYRELGKIYLTPHEVTAFIVQKKKKTILTKQNYVYGGWVAYLVWRIASGLVNLLGIEIR
jgi:hypothetical protein